MVNNLAYVAGGQDGLLILDVSNPANPTLLGSYNTSGSARRVAVDGNYAYVADMGSGLQIIRVLNPALPQRIAEVALDGPANAVAEDTVNRRFYIADGVGGICEIGIPDPYYPMPGYCLGNYGNGKDAFVQGEDHFYALSDSGLLIIHSYHEIEMKYDTPGFSEAVCAVQNHIYLADDSYFYSFRYEWPDTLTLLSGIELSASTAGLFISGNFAFVASRYSGLQVINISNPNSLRFHTRFQTPGYANGVYVKDNYIYLAAADSLYILEFHPFGPCSYLAGDVNNQGGFTGLDVVYGVSYLKGGPAPPYCCECTPGNSWFVAGDVNGSCTLTGLDITYMVAYLKGGPDLQPCPDCPPQGD